MFNSANRQGAGTGAVDAGSASICICYDVMNSPRLEGQIVFEYGTLLRAIG